MELDELLVQEGVAASREEIRAVLDAAAGEGEHPAAALVGRGIVGEDILAEVLARAAGTVVVELERGTLDEEAVGLVELPWARERLLLPVAGPVGGKLRVAFVNPLDRGSLEAVERTTGLTVQPLVATLEGMVRAHERLGRGRTTRVIAGPPSDLAPEITRRVETPQQDTRPLYRLEEDATPEQRHEALLLALVEAGVITRDDYLSALRRLLRG